MIVLQGCQRQQVAVDDEGMGHHTIKFWLFGISRGKREM